VLFSIHHVKGLSILTLLHKDNPLARKWSPTCQLWHVSKNFLAGPNKYTHQLHIHSWSWEADNHSASQEIPCFLWNLYSQDTITGPYHENILKIVMPYFIINFNITLPFMSRCSQLVSPLHILHSNCVWIYHLFTYTPWQKTSKIYVLHISVLFQVHVMYILHVSKKAWYHWKDTFTFLMLCQPQLSLYPVC